ncbi:MAG: hypothetical protein RR249_10070 [Tannerellaceae bacterium]
MNLRFLLNVLNASSGAGHWKNVWMGYSFDLNGVATGETLLPVPAANN